MSPGRISNITNIPNRSVDAARPLKVICVGAGISGILAAIRLPQKIQKLDLVVYDKNFEVGGTWVENKYPGCACDIPAHCYQLSFESNTAWSEFYASGPEILEYWKHVADKYGARKYMKLGRQVLEARWSEENAQWTVKIKDITTGEDFEDTSDIFISAIGVLNDWKWPNLPGLHDFKGKLLHSAAWDEKYDYKDKNVALIGAGSSGIQILPNIQPSVARVDHYIRGGTWIATNIAESEMKKRNPEGDNFEYSDDEIWSWKKNPEKYLQYRKGQQHSSSEAVWSEHSQDVAIEKELQSGHPITIRDSAAQVRVKKLFAESMKEKLKSRPEIADHLLPDFPPLCKRLTPGPGYLEALTKENVQVITKPISEIVASGIKDTDGEVRPVDAIICATGFDTTFTNRFPISGRHGVKLSDKWRQFPETYMSLSTSDFPNYFMLLGPNSAQGAGNLLILIERTAEYVAQCLEKIQKEHITTMVPSERSVANFTKFCEMYFEGTVHSLECSSWYKGGSKDGKVSALWPGSSLHAIEALSRPRWEDFDYSYVDDEEFGWFGDGWAERDRNGEDKSYYLDPANIDYPPVERHSAART
ncbi:MAG: hypothetical protein M1833_004866 [Piccolia ochrophora]|nr:MAG: hypothetical protein M1833_004866 [Piccolia ochrophora]